jgi:hypothetical protein
VERALARERAELALPEIADELGHASERREHERERDEHDDDRCRVGSDEALVERHSIPATRAGRLGGARPEHASFQSAPSS